MEVKVIKKTKVELPKADSSECRDFSTRTRSTTYHYFFLCLHSQSWRWPAPLSQRRLWRRRLAEAPVAPPPRRGASPTPGRAGTGRVPALQGSGGH